MTVATPEKTALAESTIDESTTPESTTLLTKLTEEKKVISITKQATLQNITEVIGCHPEEIMADIAKYGLEPDGPMIFVYRNCSCDMEAPFDMEISQPVKSFDGYTGSLDQNTLEQINVVESQYRGSLADMGPKGYEPFMAQIQKAGIQVTDQCLEIYTHYEAFDSDNNVVEIQMGVQ